MQKSLRHKSIYSALVIGLIFFLSFPSPIKCSSFSDPPKLNVLIITIDTLRADHLGVYGYEKIRTPHIDRLGKEGILFSLAYCPVPLTLPSHCSLFTGTLPVFHGVRDNGYPIPPSLTTLSEIFKDQGYNTAAFVGAFPLDSRFGLDKGFEVYNDFYKSKDRIRDLSFVERKAEAVNESALEWIKQNKDNPFFAWIHYFDPHSPYDPPAPYNIQYKRREYDGEIAYTDQIIGELLKTLEEQNLIEKTLIILTSDHGEGLGEHNEKTHGIFIYDSTLRVPLIFYNPKVLPEHRVINEPVSLIDIMPTVLDLMGFSQPLDIQGKSFRTNLFGKKIHHREYFYIESVAAMLDRNWAPLQGIRTDNWKYIHAPIPELYHMKKDPQELNNIIEKHPETAKKLEARLKEMIENFSSPHSTHVFQTDMDRETKEKLGALGYVRLNVQPNGENLPDPKNMIEVDNLFNEAIIASETGKLALAHQLYQKLLNKQSNFIIGYEYASYNLYKMGKINKAIELLEKAVHQNLITKSLLARLGLYYQEAGRIKESIEILERVVQNHKDYAEAFNYLGVSYFKANQMSKAVACFQKSLSLDKHYAMAMNNLGNCYLSLEEYDQAEQNYKQAISVDPGLDSPYNGLGVVYYRKGKINKSIEQWEKSLQINPRQADTLYNLGRVYLNQGNKKKALEFLERFVNQASPYKYKEDIEEVRKVIEKLKKELGKKKIEGEKN
ncbi:MAG TPA: sulfatase-like hydrolase/transferase [Acidobacteriota bacterium]|nr:sulfatase-like hydrolase/transferase [Acidobacteriota bacterium]